MSRRASTSPCGDGRTSVPPRARLEEAYFTALQWHVRACHDLAVAPDALERAGVPWLTFKGPVLAEAIYVRHDLRSYADLDLLVSPGRLRDAITALEGAGGQLLDRNWRLARERMHGELHVRMPMGTTVDLHWHVVNEPQLREAFVVRTEELLARARSVDIDGRPVRTLSVEDTLVHLALHACTSGGSRLLWCKDLEQAVGQVGLDWGTVVARACGWGVGPPVATMLTVASQAMHFSIAPEVIRALSPGPLWRGLANATKCVSPPQLGRQRFAAASGVPVDEERRSGQHPGAVPPHGQPGHRSGSKRPPPDGP
ncbi:MAG: nucleotidyltransferase family protein [Acidimicrobiales bacterium]